MLLVSFLVQKISLIKVEILNIDIFSTKVDMNNNINLKYSKRNSLAVTALKIWLLIFSMLYFTLFFLIQRDILANL